MKRILIDADPGIDDAFAILLALASPEISLEGISISHGNASAEQNTINTLSILELAHGSHIPVAKGCDVPLIQPSRLALETHGTSGLGYANLPSPKRRAISHHGADFLSEKILQTPGELTLICLAPLTNLALAIRREPRIVQAVKEVIVMGGALRHQGNETPQAEFNAYIDPHAAHIVYHSGLPITLVPLDVSYQCILTQLNVERLLKTQSEISTFISEASRFYIEFHKEYQNIDGCVINDALALALAFAPELCDYHELYVDIDISGGVSMGKTFADFYNYQKKPANMKVALSVRHQNFIELFLERMERLAKKTLKVF